MIKKYCRFIAVWAVVCGLLTGCGGGGAGSTNSGGSSSSSSSSSNSNNAENEITIRIDSGPTGNEHNTPYVTVTLCRTGTATCETVDHVLLDTGSTGLRILGDALSSGFRSSLTQRRVNGDALVQCMQFVSGSSWGTVKGADVKIGSYTISNMAVQIIGDPTFPTIPTSCANTGVALNTIADFGAKGILGIGHSIEDCGAFCAQNTTNLYYSCSSTHVCQPAAVPVLDQVKNPVALLPSHNNGTLIQLPALTNHEGTNVEGSLFFGVGTRANNTLPQSAAVLGVDPSTSTLTAQVGGFSYSYAAIDSGTTDWVFDDYGAMTECPLSGYYCPSSAQTFTAILAGTNNATQSFNFTIANPLSVSSSATAVDHLGGPANNTTFFLAGLPFFYGRSVWTVLEDASTTRGVGPYVAFE